MSSPTQRWYDVFSVDTRSLAAFRIGMGILLLIDLVTRVPDLSAMYTDDGMFSRAEMCRRYTSIWHWSFHLASGAPWFQSILFGVAGVFATMLCLGFQTRFATVACWILLVSVQHRVPPILNGADSLQRVLLFWSMFLPLGEVWSLDRWISLRRGKLEGASASGTPPAQSSVLSVASLAILLQMAMMYFFSAIFKSNGNWLRGEVIDGALKHAFYTTPLGMQLLDYPRLTHFLTVAVLALEWLGPVLLFVSIRRPWVRGASLLCLAAMHIGIQVLLSVGMFSFVSIAGLMLFTPTAFWDWLQQRSQALLTLGTAPKSIAHRMIPNSAWAQVLCAVALCYVFWVNISKLPTKNQPRYSWIEASLPATGLGLAQKWNMFDETPSRDGWYVAYAKLRDGSEVDLLRKGASVIWKRPEVPSELYPNNRWSKVFREMSYEDDFGFQAFREPISRYLCRDWDRQSVPDHRIAEFDLYFCMVSLKTFQNGESAPFTRREKMYHYEAPRAWNP